MDTELLVLAEKSGYKIYELPLLFLTPPLEVSPSKADER
jgi:hypothetical protein